VKSNQFFVCPKHFNGSYYMNSLGKFAPTSVNQAYIHEVRARNPSGTILVYDGWSGGTISNVGKDEVVTVESLRARGVRDRHDDGLNVLFAITMSNG